MKLIVLITIVLFLAIPAVTANNQGFDTYTIYNTAGGLGGQTINTFVYIAYPPMLPSQSSTIVSIDAESNFAQVGNIVIAVAATSLTGCTAGTLTTTAGTTFGDTERLPITLTGADCHGAIELTFTQGVTLFGRLNVRISMENADLTITDDSNGWIVSDDAGGWAIHQDEACGNPTPCQLDLTGGNVSASENNTLFGRDTISPWMPLLAGLALFAFALAPVYSGRNPEKTVLAFAAIMLIVASIVCPWQNLFPRIVIFFMAIYLLILFSVQMDDWLTERRNRKNKEKKGA